MKELSVHQLEEIEGGGMALHAFCVVGWMILGGIMLGGIMGSLIVGGIGDKYLCP